MDGILFYHKDVNYQPGVTPLVGWLKGFMVPEVLNIPVHNSYIAEKPKGYRSILEHFEFVKSGRARKNHKKSKRNQMDTSGEV